MNKIVGSSAESLLQRMRVSLRECEETYRLLVTNVEDYALIPLDKEGRISSWNIGAERIVGYGSEEVIGRHFAVFYTEDDVAHGLPQRDLTAATADGTHESEGWRVRRDGSRFLARSILTALRTDDGSVRGYGQVLRDFSVREQLEERFRRVVEAAPSAMVMINAAGCIAMVNLQAERTFGYARSELLGQPVEILVPERFRKHHPGLRRHFFSEPLSRPMGAGRDLFALRKDGSEFAVEIGLNPIETEDGTMVLSAIVDISDRKIKEDRIQAALREKDVLLAEIHHRVKNNLQIVHSLLDLQSTRIDDPTVLEMMRETQNRIQSMALIHQTLYQSRDFSGVDFGHFLDNLAPILSASYGIDQNRIALSIDTVDVLLPLNVAIPCGLFVNELVTNSLKHAFPHDRCGEVRIRLEKDSADYVCLVISDDGIGIPETVDFENTTSLGLKLVTLLAQQVEGDLTVNRSNPTQFVLRFLLSSEHLKPGKYEAQHAEL